ncbi:MAG: O-antigen ligase family protein [Chloroflexi bacterium]|nr:O-antigen ligase family protein [Chloroflexota bacterium]
MNLPSLAEERLKNITCILLLILLLLVVSGGMSPFSRFLLYAVPFVIAAAWLFIPGIRIRKFPRNLFIAGALVIIWGIVSSLFSTCPAESLSYWFLMISGFMIFLLTFQAFSTRRELKAGAAVYLLIGLLVSCVGIYLFILTHHKYGTPMYSVFFQSDIFAAFLLLFFPAVFLKFTLGRGGKRNLVWGGLALIFGVCLMLTYSRAAWLSALIVITAGIIFLLAKYRDIRHRWALMIVRIVAVSVLIILAGNMLSGESMNLKLPEKVAYRAALLTSGGDNSITARGLFWKAALKMTRLRPFLGIGPNLYDRYYARVQYDVRYYSRYAHSSLLEFWCELGYPGIILLLAFLGIFLYYLFSWLPSKSEPVGLLYVGGLCSISGALIHSGADMEWKFAGFIASFFFLAGMLLSARMERVYEESNIPWRRVVSIILILLVPFFCLNYISDLHLEAAQKYAEADEAAGAYRQASEGLSFNPFSGELYRNRSESALRLAMTGKGNDYLPVAIRDAAKAVKLDSERTSYRILLGRALEAAGNRDGALEQFLFALKLDPMNYPEISNYIAGIYIINKKPDAARKYLEKIIGVYKNIDFNSIINYRRDKIMKQLSGSYSSLANLEVIYGTKAAAVDYYRRSIELDPGNPVARFGLGQILMEKPGNEKEALENFRKVTELDPRFPDGWLKLAEVYERLGMAREAGQARNKGRDLLYRIKQGL